MRKFSIGIFFNCFGPYNNSWKKQRELIDSLKELGHIELLLEHLPTTKLEISFIKSLKKRYRLVVHAPFLDINLLSEKPSIIKSSYDILAGTYQFGLKMGCEVFTMHVGVPPFFAKRDRLELTTRLILVLKRLQKSKKLPVAVENMPQSPSIIKPYPSTLSELLPFASSLNITLDVGHALQNGENPIDFIGKNIAGIENLHLHDGNRHKSHLSLGEGTLDLPALLRILEEKNYDRFVTLEVMGEEDIRNSWNKLLSHL